MPFRRPVALRHAPSLPIAVLLLAAPVLAVAQFRALALAATIGFAAAAFAHWRVHRALPWPRRGPIALAALALFGWCLLSAAWAIEPVRAADSAARQLILVLLAAMAARAVAEDAPENRRIIGPCLVIGLALGTAIGLFDMVSGHAFRAAVRGLQEAPPTLAFGLKPAASVLVTLGPLALLVAPLSRVWRAAVAAAAVGAAFLLPSESAKLAAVVAVLAWIAAAGLPRLAPRGIAVALAALMLATPLLIVGTLAYAPHIASRLPPSAAHRVVIWDFTVERIAERPLFGWGMEASRAVPGGRDRPEAERFERLGLDSPIRLDWFAATRAQLLPLHPHNGPLQVWLELGAVGAVAAAALALALGLAAASIGAPAVAVFVAAAVVGQLSYGVWQAWWIAAQLLVPVALAGILPPQATRSPAGKVRLRI